MGSQSENVGRGPRIEAIDRAIQLLETLAAAGSGGVALGDLSDRLGMSKATAYRALATMRLRGFVAQARDGEYVLGPQALALTDLYFSQENLQTVLRPTLAALAHATNELVHLGVWDGDDIIYLDKVDGGRGTLRVWSAVGQRVPAASTALGRALLAVAAQGECELQRFVEAVPERRITRARLREAIEEARRTGFSSEMEENEPGVACLGFAIISAKEPIAAISITAPAARMTPHRINELKAAARKQVRESLPESLEPAFGSVGSV